MKIRKINFSSQKISNMQEYMNSTNSNPIKSFDYFKETKDVFEVSKKADSKKNNYIKYAIAFAGAAALSTTIAAFIKKGISDTNKTTLVTQDVSWDKLQEVIGINAKTSDEMHKAQFVKGFIEPIKNGKTPLNGFLVQGPDSKGKKEFFNWCISEMEKAGVEIVDTTDEVLGHSTKQKINEAWDLFTPKQAEQFKKDGKYRLLVLTGAEKIDPNRDYIGANMRGFAAKSAQNFGVMLAYDCQDIGNIRSAVTRIERIDKVFIPSPKTDESLEVWKEYLQVLKKHSTPMYIQKQIDEATEIISSKGQKALEEMSDSLYYHAPYKVPKLTDKMRVWNEYFAASKRDVDEHGLYNEMRNVTIGTVEAYLHERISKRKYEAIIAQILDTTPKKYLERIQALIKNELAQRI